MTGNMAEAIAVVLGGTPVKGAPQSRGWCVEWVRPDGKFLSIEVGGAYLFASESAYRAFHAGEDYEVSPVIDGAEWAYWGHGDWPKSFAEMIGGEAHCAGGNSWVVLWTRPDGRFVCIGGESACIMRDRAVWDSMDPSDDDGTEHFEFA